VMWEGARKRAIVGGSLPPTSRIHLLDSPVYDNVSLLSVKTMKYNQGVMIMAI
jgi:hypothetical protein